MITTSKLKEYIEGGHDKYKIAQWLLNVNIAKHIPMTLNDLRDSSVVADEVEAIVECLEQGDYKDALNLAEEGAMLILEEEGFEISS